MSTVSTHQCSSVSMMHFSRNDSVETVWGPASFLDMKSLCLFLPATVLPFRVLSLLSLSKIWDYRIVFLCYLINSFLCIGMIVSLIWSCLIS